jgi:hypothetical protein
MTPRDVKRPSRWTQAAKDIENLFMGPWTFPCDEVVDTVEVPK